MLCKILHLNDETLSDIANSEETELCKIMNGHGSDKGSGHHNYTKLYSKLFSDIRNEKLNILEIGIGSVNPSIVSNMCGCRSYKPGSSQRGWRDYFPNATVYACDIDKDILNFDDPRIKGFYMDQRDTQGIIQKFYIGDLKDVMFDIIIDDGLHAFDVNWMVMKVLLSKLSKGGIYIIEDLLDFNPNKSEPIQGYQWKYLRLPNRHNNVDNNLILATQNI